MKILVTGGTVFVSRFTAEYFSKENSVYVLNRNTRTQSKGVTLINADRHAIGDKLKDHEFDAVIDVSAYNKEDVEGLLNSSVSFKSYVFISSSAVYSETLPQPFKEDMPLVRNSLWGDYSANKIAAEKYLYKRVPKAYIIRPPYLYGKMNNLYREAFVFECAERNKPFYIPGNGDMKLQFFDIEDMCRFIEILLKEQPENRVFNVGNPELITVCDWAQLCYNVLGKEPKLVNVKARADQREYFPFRDYSYKLDVTKMNEFLPNVKALSQGLSESYEWFSSNREKIQRKNYFEYIKDVFEVSERTV